VTARIPELLRVGLLALACMWLAPAPGLAADADPRLADAAARHDAAAVRRLLAEGVDVNARGTDGTPALHWAVQLGDVALTELLLAAGADATLASRYDVTPLALAAAGANPTQVARLVDAGADPNARDQAGDTMLMSAARAGSAETVGLLLDLGAVVDATEDTYDQTALAIAVQANHPDVVALLLARGASAHATTRVGRTPSWVLPNSVPGFGHGVGIVRGGLPDRGQRPPIPGGMTPLHYAARDGRLDIARALLDAGAAIDATDRNDIAPLLLAIVNNHVDVARFLIARGADVHAVDWYGRTPLWAAVETRNMDVDNASFENSIDREPFLGLIRDLLDRGVDPDVRMREWPPVRRAFLRATSDLSWVDLTGQTPFLKAALHGDVTVMRLLLDHGADPAIPTYGGTTALMAAAGVNWVVDQTWDEGPAALIEAVRLCADLGLDVNAINSMGLTALHGAANRGSDDIIRFLVERGARLDVADNEGRTPMTWAEGVFLATHPARPKPATIALLEELGAGREARR
jgi:ankyrin repeat protein